MKKRMPLIYSAHFIKGISDEEQVTKEIIQHLSLQFRVTKIEGKAGFIKLTHEGLTWCIAECDKPKYSRTR